MSSMLCLRALVGLFLWLTFMKYFRQLQAGLYYFALWGPVLIITLACPIHSPLYRVEIKETCKCSYQGCFPLALVLHDCFLGGLFF